MSGYRFKTLVESKRVRIVEHESGDLTGSFALDRERSLSVVYIRSGGSIPVGRTTVYADNRDPEETLQLHAVEGDGTFSQGLAFAFTLMTVLELLQPWEMDDLRERFDISTDAVGLSRATLRTIEHHKAS